MCIRDSLGNAVDTFDGNVTFANNNATINGDAIFVTSLNACNISSKGILSYCIAVVLVCLFSFVLCLQALFIVRKSWVLNLIPIHPIIIHSNQCFSGMNGTIPWWNNFNFLPRDHNHVTTRTARIKVYESEWNQPPGKPFTPKIILFDQLGNHVSEQINVKIQPQTKCEVQVETNPQFVVSNNDDITLSLLGNNQPIEKNPKLKCNFTVIAVSYTHLTLPTKA